VQGTAYGFYWTSKLTKESVAGRLHKSASALPNARLEDLFLKRLYSAQCAFLVLLHHRREANYVCSEDRGKAAQSHSGSAVRTAAIEVAKLQAAGQRGTTL
jgi:hypothetical protein